jgi:single-strand DNA-binding protein
MTVKGVIKRINQVQTFKSGSYKRSLVINTIETYPQVLEVEFWNDGADALDSYLEGMEVQIEFNLNGREWTSPQGKTSIFTSLKGYKIDPLQEVGGGSPGQSRGPLPGNPGPGNTPPAAPQGSTNQEEDDLPF